MELSAASVEMTFLGMEVEDEDDIDTLWRIRANGAGGRGKT
jgi:hypothetical protein